MIKKGEDCGRAPKMTCDGAEGRRRLRMDCMGHTHAMAQPILVAHGTAHIRSARLKSLPDR